MSEITKNLIKFCEQRQLSYHIWASGVSCNQKVNRNKRVFLLE